MKANNEIETDGEDEKEKMPQFRILIMFILISS